MLTSFWRVPGGSSHSGTPTDWIAARSTRVVEVYCVCDPEIAANRFVTRDRHTGHLDSTKQIEDVVSNFRNLVAKGHLGIGKLVQVDMSSEVDLDDVVSKVKTLLEFA